MCSSTYPRKRLAGTTHARSPHTHAHTRTQTECRPTPRWDWRRVWLRQLVSLETVLLQQPSRTSSPTRGTSAWVRKRRGHCGRHRVATVGTRWRKEPSPFTAQLATTSGEGPVAVSERGHVGGGCCRHSLYPGACVCVCAPRATLFVLFCCSLSLNCWRPPCVCEVKCTLGGC